MTLLNASVTILATMSAEIACGTYGSESGILTAQGKEPTPFAQGQ